MSLVTPIATLFVLLGCCTNVIFLELLVKAHPGSGNLVTFAQFLLIVLEGLFMEVKFFTKKSHVPLQNYIVLVGMFFAVSVINNYALNFNIAMPLHMIFRSGSLMANLILGVIILHKRYPLSKYLSVLMITTGIAICTIASAGEIKKAHDEHHAHDNALLEYLWWILGISMLLFALFMSARMGIFQEVLYAEFGKHPREALFYCHFLPLPGFLLLYSDIWRHAKLFSAAEPLTFLGLALPSMWWFLIGNVLTQYVCIRSVFVLTTECSSLTVTLIITLRKFISLVFSIVYFANPFTGVHWAGTCLVFSGTLLFSDIPTKAAAAIWPRKPTDKVE